jgi:Ca2+-binding EF-hand superfamily protein
MIAKPTARMHSGQWALPAIRFTVTVACAFYAFASFATDAEDYLRRAAQRDEATFYALDRNKDGRLTIEETRGNIDMEARFNDIDINRDGVITREELVRYIALQYGVAFAPK